MQDSVIQMIEWKNTTNQAEVVSKYFHGDLEREHKEEHSGY